MLQIILFIGTAAFLTCEGALFLRLFAGRALSLCERWLLGYAVGALLNALLFFLCTILTIPLTPAVLLTLHVFIICGIGVIASRIGPGDAPADTPRHAWRSLKAPPRFLLVFLCILIAVKLLYGFSHAVILPTFYFDSLSQWNMRAKVSYEDRAIAFDATEERGISKPQYPIYTHALQIIFATAQGGWSDASANAATFLVTLSMLFSVAAVVRRRRGIAPAVLVIVLPLMMPLFTMHLVQGHGDIHVLMGLFVSALFLGEYGKSQSREDLFLSVIGVCIATWAKQEGLFFGVLLWLPLALWAADRSRAGLCRSLRWGWAPVLAIAMPWTIYLLFRGLPISAHPGDFSLAWHGEALGAAARSLFASGSFGIFWYVVCGAFLLLTIPLQKKGDAIGASEKRALPIPVLWGGMSFVLVLIIFLATPNVAFLLNQQTFHRTMLIPLILFLLPLALRWGALLQEGDSTTLAEPWYTPQP